MGQAEAGEREEDRKDGGGTSDVKKEFWKCTNQEYGAFGFEKNKLANAVNDFHVVNAIKPHYFHPHRTPSTPNVSKNFIESPIKDGYRHQSKDEHCIYTTTANSIGFKKPNPVTDGPGRIYPHSNSFTKTFPGMQRDCGLNTTMTKNRFLDD